ncbi:DeoR/GlpR family DNA-binding transcription regulator [Tanticharoenia sakaeratensis]|uniref:DeoR/GlpR family DNA-binding transcription regulator n=1 Tax=Tanticharoenia sakaeratensis TaxID=444053 RepID=UPI002156AA37|nr:DeoR/GlpR family DNA-binding transcription regulator [Tanticharoenia sakaeratensis]GBQ24074.1 transcriptional regulator [Tanticharoenia sakaeratensis NBRC 103193]
MSEAAQELITRRRETTQRQQRILDLLFETGGASIDDLATRFAVSRMTIHRDADALVRQGLINKIHGGLTVRNRATATRSVSYRQSRAPHLKQAIITQAVARIVPEQVLVLDDSTTVAEMLPLLPARAPLTIITNAMGVIQTLSPYAGLKLICIGGEYSAPRNAFFGLVSEQGAQSLRANTMFLSTSVIHGATAFQNDQDVVMVKRALMGIADHAILLADSTKFRKAGLHRLADLQEFDEVLTDDGLSDTSRKNLTEAGVNLTICN